MRGNTLSTPCIRQRVLACAIRSVFNPLALTASITCFSLLPVVSLAGPAGGVIVGGNGSINTSNLTTTITQNSSALAINWNSFNLDRDDIVNFIQPNVSSIALNRILSSTGSQIHGQINANGQVILVNPNGIFFGATAQVNVGGLIASGLDINTDDFMNGNYQFRSVDNTGGIVSNIGFINAATGGSVTLLGKQVINEGIIAANLGAINLAAGHEAVVTFDDAGYVGVKVTKEILQNELGIDPAILNSGEISVQGGRILLTASQSQDLFSQAVNTGAIKKATSLVMHEDGTFTLGRGADVVNTGTLDVSTTEINQNAGQVVVLGENITSNGVISADAQQGNGGDIELHALDTALLSENSLISARAENNGAGGVIKLLGDKVGVFDASVVDASGADGGGELYIGGGFQGSNTLLRNAQYTYVAGDANLIADALQQGDGGQVIVWADGSTQYYGTISARGGNVLGDGGFAEVSGKQGLIFEGEVDLSVSVGNNGTLLLDPKNITIWELGTSHLNPDGSFRSNYDEFADLSNIDTWLSNTDLNNRLNDFIVVLSANTDINVQANISGTNSLTLNAGRSISLSDNVTINLNGGNFTATINHENARCDDNCSQTITNQRDPGPAVFTMAANSSITTNGGAINITTGTFNNAGYEIGDITLQTLNSSGAAGTNAGAISISHFGGDVIAHGAITAIGGTASGNSSGYNGGAVNISGANVTLNTVDTHGSNASGTVDNNGGNGGNITVNVTENNGTPSIVLDGNVITAGGRAVNDADTTSTAINGTRGTVAINLNGDNASGNATITYLNITSEVNITNNTTGDNRFFQGANRNRVWSYDEAGGRYGYINFTGFNELRGGEYNDTFALDSTSDAIAFNGAILGGGGSDVLYIYGDGNRNWNINSNNVGEVGGVNFSSIENLWGGDGDDTFNFYASVDGAVQGRAGNDVFNIFSADVVLENIHGDSPYISSVTGSDTLAVFVNNANLWNITSNNSGTLNTSGSDNSNIYFTSIENLIGGSGVDTFNIAANVDGTVSGGAGDDVFTISADNLRLNLVGGDDTDTLIGFNRVNQTNAWSITGNNAGNLNNQINFSQIENLTGNNNTDTFTFTTANASLSGLIDGGTGTLNLNGFDSQTDSVNYAAVNGDLEVTLGQSIVNIESVTGNYTGNNNGSNINSTLIGNNFGHTWNITGSNAGNVDNQISFTNFNNLTGGSGDDTFVFTSTASPMSGRIDGGAGNGIDTADYSQISNVIVNLGSSLNGIRGVESLHGNNIDATLVGDNVINSWDITAENSGNVQNGTVAFNGFNNLTGGDQDDTFTINSGGQVTGQILGMAGNDTLNITLTGVESGQINFNGGVHDANGDRIVLTGGSADYAVIYDSNLAGADQLAYNANGAAYTVRYLNTEHINDNVIAASLIINGTAADDAIVLGNGQFTVNNSASVNSSNKDNLIVNTLDGIDVVNVSGDVNITGNVAITAETLTNTTGVITADSLWLSDVQNAGTNTARISTNINQLYLQNISGAVYLNEADALRLAELSAVNGTLDVQAVDDITQDTSITSAANLTLASSMGHVMLDAPANALTGLLSLSGSNVRLLNLADTQLGNVNAQTLSVDVSGDLVDVDTAVMAVTGTSDLNAGGNIVLDGINGVSTHQFGDVTAAARNVTLAAENMSVNLITAESLIALRSNTSITDANVAGINLITDRIELNAQTGIDLDSETGAMSVVNASTGNINLDNTGNVLIEMLRNTGGNITFSNNGAINVDRIETSGHLGVTWRNGNFLGVGQTPNHTEADADIVANTATFTSFTGNFGAVRRPIVAYIPGNVTVLSRISFAPVFLPPEPKNRIVDDSFLTFSALDTLSSLAGEQVVEVENLDDVDPAIFTNIQNYNMSDIAIRMPKDQLFDEDF